MRRRRAQPVGGLTATITCTCAHCGQTFQPNHRGSHGLFCSMGCRDAHSAAGRRPGRFALIVFCDNGDVARFAYFDTPAEVQAAAPAKGVFSIVDRCVKARRPRPSVDEIIKATRPVLATPYPQHDQAARNLI
jgi:hypothetical protein